MIYSKLGDVRVLNTSGTTGRKKRYLWGPHFIDVNRFYFYLARLDEGTYRKGLKVSRQDLDSLNLRTHETCPALNYTITPRPKATGQPSENPAVPAGGG